MKTSKRALLIYLLAVSAGLAVIFVDVTEPEYAYMPPEDKVLPSENGTGVRSAANDGDLALGRETFYKETFGNEVFLTDIMGIVDGPLTRYEMAKAILKLRGKGTTNLKVKLSKDAAIGGKKFKKGQVIDTGIDVPKGSFAPLGMPVKASDGVIKVGVTCAACHATVDVKTKKVIEGAPNRDLNTGLVMALATNSAAYFTHTDIKNVKKYMSDLKRTVIATDGKTARLPDPGRLEHAVDANLLKWPRGNFDSTIDMESNPSQIPDSFTLKGHPYGWSGFAAAGPFHGLSAFSNNVHAQNADSLAQSPNSYPLFNIDKEVYLGILLQNAANPKFRFDPAKYAQPSAFFAAVDPTPGVPGVNELIKPPSFPKVNLFAPDGLFASSPGYKAGQQINAVAAWQNTLLPASFRTRLDPAALAEGQRVFQRARCIACHAGDAFTNNRIISSRDIGTEPSRAKALKATGKVFGPTAFYSYDTPVPIPKNAEIRKIPTDHLDPEQLRLGFAHGDSPGGYKVKGLIGLYWTAPYLHDGGAAVGPDAERHLGFPGTLGKGIEPDPANSLRALLDRNLRRKVIEANMSSPALRDVHVKGIGHEFWVDEQAGFTKKQQEGLIQYLLHLRMGD